MCLSLRNTLSRGRSGVPTTLARTDHFLRCNRTCLSLFLSAINPTLSHANLFRCRASARKRLARLDLHHFTVIPDALALIRLGLAHLADVARKLTNQLLVWPGHVNLQPLNLNR